MDANTGRDETQGGPSSIKEELGESRTEEGLFESNRTGSGDDRRYDELSSYGIKLLKQKRWDEAVTIFTKALNIKPEMDILYMHRALAFLRLKNYQDAEADCTQALVLRPDLAKAYLRRSKARKLLGKFTYAALDLVKVMELQHELELPMSVVRNEYDDLIFSVIHNLDCRTGPVLKAQYAELSRKEEYFGKCFLEEQRWGEAVIKLTNAIKLTLGCPTPRLRDLFCSRGSCWKNMGHEKFDLAEKDYSSAISIDDKNCSLYSKRSLIRSEMGNRTGALEDLARMMVLNTDSKNIPLDLIKRYLDASARLQCIKSVVPSDRRLENQKRHTNPENASEPYGGVLLIPGLVSSSDDDFEEIQEETPFVTGNDSFNGRSRNTVRISDSDIDLSLEHLPFVFRDKDFEEEIDDISTTDEENVDDPI